MEKLHLSSQIKFKKLNSRCNEETPGNSMMGSKAEEIKCARHGTRINMRTLFTAGEILEKKHKDRKKQS